MQCEHNMKKTTLGKLPKKKKKKKAWQQQTNQSANSAQTVSYFQESLDKIEARNLSQHITFPYTQLYASVKS